MPVSREASALLGVCPSNSTWPSMMPTVLRLEITSISVDLPAPEDPISAIMLPGSSVPERGSSPPSRYFHSFLFAMLGTLYRSWYSVTWIPDFSDSPKDLDANDLVHLEKMMSVSTQTLVSHLLWCHTRRFELTQFQFDHFNRALQVRRPTQHKPGSAPAPISHTDFEAMMVEA